MKTLAKNLFILFALLAWGQTVAADEPQTADELFQRCEDSYLSQDYATALKQGTQALQLCEGTDMEADCLNLLAMICFRLSDYEQAIGYAQRCYKLDAQTGDADVMSSSLNTLAGICIGANQPKEAEKYILQALELGKQVDNPARMAVLRGTASEVYHALGNDQEALKHIDAACDIEQKLGRQDKLAVRQTQKASVLVGLHRYAEAEEILRQAIPVLKETGDYHSLGIADNKMGMAILQQGRNKEAVPYYEEAAYIFVQMGDLTNEMHAQRGLYESLWKSDPDSAKVHLERFDLLKDSLYSNATAEMMARYNAEFGLDQLKRENELQQEEQASHRRHMRYIIIGVVLLLLLVAGILWWMHRQFVKREKTLQEFFASQDEERGTRNEEREARSEEGMLTATDRQFLDKLNGFIQNHLQDGGLSIESLASEMCITRGQLNRRVKTITGATTQQYVLRLRLEQAMQLLQTSELTISEIGYRCGFEDATSFSRAFKRTFGQPPTQYRNG